MRLTIKTGLAVIMSIAISCTKEGTDNAVTVSSQSVGNSVTAHYIGQRFGGGIIFYIDVTGNHGYIADTVDLKPITWNNNGVYTQTGAFHDHINAGYSNTKKIIESQGDSGRYAARRCWNSNASGYTDWFLPSKKQLIELYKQKSVVGGFAIDLPYWSSSETSIGQSAWVKSFADGYQTGSDKGNTNNVRAVRAF